MKDGGAAFVGIDMVNNGGYEFSSGMTLRDWFAGQVISGLLYDTIDTRMASRQAYRFADAMLEEREKE